ncbi:hypothetical protein EVAR_6078_1 [Eumeta japonica]|uniref:Mos1 transposase HTH domain-containing protein n=1 Tax=Eumeta variegata TaxID=151549 RepID=A0A4C1TDY1_EUMVA|nr:hypothetical protein EVAR_6078_1 [Eumeta japonica]
MYTINGQGRNEIDVETCIGIETVTWTGRGSGTKIYIENKAMITIKINRKLADVEDEEIHFVSMRAKQGAHLNDECNLTAQKSLARLLTVFGDESSCKTTIYTWFAECKRSRFNLIGEFSDGRLSTAVNNKTSTRRIIKTDRHVTYHEIWASLIIGMSQI